MTSININTPAVHMPRDIASADWQAMGALVEGIAGDPTDKHALQIRGARAVGSTRKAVIERDCAAYHVAVLAGDRKPVIDFYRLSGAGRSTGSANATSVLKLAEWMREDVGHTNVTDMVEDGIKFIRDHKGLSGAMRAIEPEPTEPEPTDTPAPVESDSATACDRCGTTADMLHATDDGDMSLCGDCVPGESEVTERAADTADALILQATELISRAATMVTHGARVEAATGRALQAALSELSSAGKRRTGTVRVRGGDISTSDATRRMAGDPANAVVSKLA